MIYLFREMQHFETNLKNISNSFINKLTKFNIFNTCERKK